jgi:hypothetical protein
MSFKKQLITQFYHHRPKLPALKNGMRQAGLVS